MNTGSHLVFLICLTLLRTASRLLPLRSRREWLNEWTAELIGRRERLRRQHQLTVGRDLELLVRVLGSFRHVLYLRTRFLGEIMLLHDLKQALRTLSARPGFSLLLLATLTLGVGANTAIFTIFDHVLLRPLPFRESSRLYVPVWSNLRESGIDSLPYQDFQDLREQVESFQEMAIWSWFGGTLQAPGEPLSVWGYQVSPGLLGFLGVTPSLGRDFTPEESRQSAPVVILSHQVWQELYAGDPSLVGRAVSIDDQALTVVGILPAGFDLPFPRPGAQLWVPIDPNHSWTKSRSIYTYFGLGRLAPGVSPQRLASDLQTVSRRLQQDYPETNRDRVYSAAPLLDLAVGQVRPPLLLLGGAVVLLLLIVCSNLAGLLLVRGVTRSRELALRLALGAKRGQLVRQLLTETLLLSLVGAASSLLAAWILLPLLLRLAGDSLPRVSEITVDGRVFLFALGTALFSGVAVSLLPAFKVSGLHLSGALLEGDSRISAGAGWRRFLVAAEIGLALSLLAGTGLLIGSLIQVLRLDPGFDPSGRVSFQVSLPPGRYPDMSDLLTFFSRLRSELGSQPGIEKIGVVSSLPLSGHSSGSALTIEGKPLPESELPTVGWQFILPGYLESLDIDLLAGRRFEESDLRSGAHQSLINQAAARQFFGDTNPIGRRIITGVPGDDWHEIIGVVADTRHRALDQEPEPRVYDLFGQHGGRNVFVVVRGRQDSAALIRVVRQQVYALDPQLPMQDLRPLEELIGNSTQSRRFQIQILAFFALVALLLASLGIYGVSAFWVTQRKRELGIRIALGAPARRVIGLVIWQILPMVGLGIGLGWIGSWLAARAFSGLLYRIDPVDPLIMALVTLFLLGVTLASCYIPARRASLVDPVRSLRSD